MSTHPCSPPAPTLIWAVLIASSIILAQSVAAADAQRSHPGAIGLPRLDPRNIAGSSVMGLEKFEVYLGNERSVRGKRVAAIERRQERQFALRSNAAANELYVSIVATASDQTEFRVFGNSLRLENGPMSGCAELKVRAPAPQGGTEWRSLGIHVRYAQFGELTLAALPPLTFRYDKRTGVSELYVGKYQVDFALPATKADGEATAIIAGASGVLLSAIVQADENPLFDDANSNGVDDAFETEIRRQTPSEINPQQMKWLWRQYQKAHRLEAVRVDRPMPNAATGKDSR